MADTKNRDAIVTDFQNYRLCTCVYSKLKLVETCETCVSDVTVILALNPTQIQDCNIAEANAVIGR